MSEGNRYETSCLPFGYATDGFVLLQFPSAPIIFSKYGSHLWLLLRSWAIRLWVVIVWNWNNYSVWCPSLTSAVWCSKYYFTNRIHYCYYLESAHQAEPSRVQGLLKMHHRDLWQAQFYYKKTFIYFKYILDKACALSYGKTDLLATFTCACLAPKITMTDLHWSQCLISPCSHWQGLLKRLVRSCCLCSTQCLQWTIYIPVSVSAVWRLSWQKRPKVWQTAWSSFTCTPHIHTFHLTPTFLPWTLVKYCLLLLEREFFLCHLPYCYFAVIWF